MANSIPQINIHVIRQAQQGNQKSVSQLTVHARDKVLLYIYRLTLNHDLTEDLTQETMLQLLGALKRLDLPNRQSFWAWLYRTALSNTAPFPCSKTQTFQLPIQPGYRSTAGIHR